jgi:hypothetical protein
MRRLFWLALGASLGVLIFRRLSRAAEKMSPQGIASSLAASLSDLGYTLREFADDVRDAMSAQETALRTAAGLDSGSTDGLAAGANLNGAAQTGAEHNSAATASAAPSSAATIDAITVEGPAAGGPSVQGPAAGA